MGSFQSASDHAVLIALVDDPAALEELFRRYRRDVVGYAARRCDRPADVDDVVAATFLAVLECAGSYDPTRGEVRAWLLGVAHNQLGLLRRGERRQRELERVADRATELSEDAFARLLEQIAAAQEGPAMQRALWRLPEDQREALLLVSADELSMKEAAALLGISAAAFRVRLFRARRAMVAQLSPAASEHEHRLQLPEEAEQK